MHVFGNESNFFLYNLVCQLEYIPLFVIFFKTFNSENKFKPTIS